MVRHITGDDRTRSHDCINSNPEAREHRCTGSHRGARTNLHAPRENGAGGNMRAITHHTIVLDYRTGIDDHALAHGGRGVHHGEWEDHRTAPEE